LLRALEVVFGVLSLAGSAILIPAAWDSRLQLHHHWYGTSRRRDPEYYFPTGSVITAGSACALAMTSRQGPFEDEFFIEGVDTVPAEIGKLGNGSRALRFAV
jgi:hypothetical protein